MLRMITNYSASTLGFAVLALVALAFTVVAPGGAALAAQPEPWQLGFQPAASPVMEAINQFHNFVLVIIVLITLFVLALLIYCIVKFNAKANPTPSRTSHNTTIEVVWTVVPVIILVIIAIPSFRLLYFEQTIPEPDLTIKATGYTWYWGYEYPDHDEMQFESIMLTEDELQPGQPRLLAVDNEVVVPVGKVIKMQVTAADVLHNWTVPAFGAKIDAVPGRLNETWFQVDRPGVYYGQCSELCGSGHAFMPIAVRALPEAEFNAWLEGAKAEFARAPRPERNVAEVEAETVEAETPAIAGAGEVAAGSETVQATE